MATLNELIQQYCPNGVEYKHIWEVTDWDKRFSGVEKSKQPKVLKFIHIPAQNLKKLEVENGNIKLNSTGKYIGYTTEQLAEGLINEGEIISIPSGGSCSIKYLNEKFVDSGNIICQSKDSEILNLKYLFYFMISIQSKIEMFFRGSGIKHPSMKEILEIKIPLPPIEVQNKIVEILNGFQQVADGLKAEKEFRQKQFEEYREKCLNFEPKEIAEMLKEQCPNGVEEKSIGECILSLHTGLNPRNFFKLNTPDAKNYYVTIKEMIDGKIIFNNKTNKINDAALTLCNNRSNLEVNDILFSGTGSIGNTCLLKETPTNWNIKEGIYSLKPNQEVINPKFLNFALNSSNINEIINNKINGSAVKSIKMNDLKAIQISLPSLSVQNKIVKYLETFEKLIEGLEKEYQLRLQQLNYYTEKLLQFKELKNTAK